MLVLQVVPWEQLVLMYSLTGQAQLSQRCIWTKINNYYWLNSFEDESVLKWFSFDFGPPPISSCKAVLLQDVLQVKKHMHIIDNNLTTVYNPDYARQMKEYGLSIIYRLEAAYAFSTRKMNVILLQKVHLQSQILLLKKVTNN